MFRNDRCRRGARPLCQLGHLQHASVRICYPAGWERCCQRQRHKRADHGMPAIESFHEHHWLSQRLLCSRCRSRSLSLSLSLSVSLFRGSFASDSGTEHERERERESAFGCGVGWPCSWLRASKREKREGFRTRTPREPWDLGITPRAHSSKVSHPRLTCEASKQASFRT